MLLPRRTFLTTRIAGKTRPSELASREPNEQHLKGRMGGRLQVLEYHAQTGPFTEQMSATFEKSRLTDMTRRSVVWCRPWKHQPWKFNHLDDFNSASSESRVNKRLSQVGAPRQYRT